MLCFARQKLLFQKNGKAVTKTAGVCLGFCRPKDSGIAPARQVYVSLAGAIAHAAAGAL
jgi:hypothetical protein